MALLESDSDIKMLSKAENFTNLPGTDGKMYSLSSFDTKEMLVIIFMCNHCPYVQAILDRLIALQNNYLNQSVQIVGINPNDTTKYPDDSFEQMQSTVKEKGINFVYLQDETQEVAKRYKAQCTPDIFVYNKSRELIYHGRIDDNWKNENEVTKQELKQAIDTYINTQQILEQQFPSMGCSIKWKQ